MKLRKTLPESRSQRKKRLESENGRKKIDAGLAVTRREQMLALHDTRLGVWRTWLFAYQNRLKSDETYARFEAIHEENWDLYRQFGMPTTELFLAIQRARDGRSTDLAPLIAHLESVAESRAYWSFGALDILKRRVISSEISDSDRERLRVVILAVVNAARWHREFARYARLARHVASPEFVAELEERAREVSDTSPRAAAILEHIRDQKRLDDAKRERAERKKRPARNNRRSPPTDDPGS